MHNLIRFYNQNRKTIFRIILIIVLLILVLQILNGLTKQKYSTSNIRNTMQNTIQNTAKTNSINKEIKSNKSLVTGQSVNTNKLESDTDVIKKFMDLCNNQDIENAYSYLSTDCKEKVFPNINRFIEIYYNKIFNGEKKIYTIENWTANTYKIEISKDIMSTGKINDNQAIQDYITISENEQNKLNINGYIGKTALSKETEKDNINIKVVEKNEYMDYTVFTFEFMNTSANSIALDLLNDVNSMYIVDGSNVKHYAYTHELSKSQLIVDSNTKKRVNIKYYSKYTSTRKIEEIAFSKVVLNYMEEDNFINNYCSMIIDL